MKPKSLRPSFGTLWALLVLIPSVSIGQEAEKPQAQAAAEVGAELVAQEGSVEAVALTKPLPPRFDESAVAQDTAILRVWNRRIVELRAELAGNDPAERVAQAAEHITSLADSLLEEEVWVEPTKIREFDLMLVGVEDQVLLSLRLEDLDPASDQTLEELGTEVAGRIQQVLRAQAEQRHWPNLVRAILFSLAATLIFVALIAAILRFRSRFMQSWAQRIHRRGLTVSGFDLGPHLRNLIRGTVVLVSWALLLPLTYLWLTFVLNCFPFTRPLGVNLGNYLVELVTDLLLGALSAVPGLFTVFLIFLATRFLTRLVGAFFLSVEKEALQVHWLQPETAKATRRLVIVVMWIFALTVAYPYIPGSSSAAFKGVSVFVGLMISLGATGLVNQIVSGMVIVYTRAFRPGEYVRIGEVEGLVEEIGVLSTKVSTLRREHITIPNAVLINTSVNNFSREAAEQGAVISTSVTIGYDVPWRQVHALLMLAASRCAGIRQEPAPRVLQKGLSEFYVEYTLLVSIDDPAQRYIISSELHGQIQDAFNEQGVQILSPHYLDKAEAPVVVPKEDWAPPPTDPESA
jgi:small-conductance mechanosensitive channel